MEKVLVCIIGILGAIVFVGIIMMCVNVIPWMLWNHAVAPTFGWPHITFFKCFLLCWAITFLGRMIFGQRSTK